MIEFGKVRFPISDDFASIYDVQDGYTTFRFFIGGEWRSSNEKDQLISPLDQTSIGAVYRTPIDQVDLAIRLAKESQQKIRSLAGIERIGLMNEARNILMDHREDFIRALMLEGGKTREGASGEIESLYLRMGLTMEDARKIFGEYMPGDWSKDTASKIALVIREPVGVVAAVGPFNYPLFIPAAKIIPALLAGNSVVVKPTKETPVSTIMFAEVL
ncbi:MAG: aldehyde dehydrogenase family protein, partial [Conexivisphaerales archaeon]